MQYKERLRMQTNMEWRARQVSVDAWRDGSRVKQGARGATAQVQATRHQSQRALPRVRVSMDRGDGSEAVAVMNTSRVIVFPVRVLTKICMAAQPTGRPRCSRRGRGGWRGELATPCEQQPHETVSTVDESSAAGQMRVQEKRG